MKCLLQKKQRRRYLLVAICINAMIVLGYGYYWMKINVPSEIKLLIGQEENFDFSIPIEASIFNEDAKGVLYVNQQPLSKEEINIDLSTPFSVSSRALGEYEVQLKLFGILPIKEISLEVIEELEVMPGGSVIGLQVETDGILVLGTGEVVLKDGNSVEPAKGLLKSGDYIIGVNGKKNITRKDLLNSIGEELLHLIVKRGQEQIKVD